MSSVNNSVSETNQGSRTISGRVIVVGMFSLGILATGILWFYWNLHLMPFMPLQEALAEEFENSSPRVDGGRRKTHKGTPMILRVVMRVPFNPTSSNAEAQSQIERRIQRTLELAAVHVEIEKYDLLRIHMYQERKEQVLHQKEFEKDLKAMSVPASDSA